MAESGDSALRRFRANLQGEIDGAAVYSALAESEPDPRIADVYRRLAAVEEAHGEFWRKRIAEAGGGAHGVRPTARARLLAWLGRRFGPSFVLPTIADNEVRDSTTYDDQPDASAAGLPGEEKSHALLMRAAADGKGLPGSSLARLEGRHRSGGNALRAAVLGGNDGLVSNLSLVMGVAGASAQQSTLILTGMAGLLAGACSMAMGEWLSVTSSRELYQSQIDAEAEELRTVPEEEREELVLIYQAKGLEEAQARALADKLLSDPDSALDTLAREELGINPDDLGGSAWGAAASSFALFSVGAIFPVAPLLFVSGDAAIAASLGSSAFALALIGAGTSLFTGRGMAFSMLRQVLIGLAAAGVTYAAGMVAGTALAS